MTFLWSVGPVRTRISVTRINPNSWDNDAYWIIHRWKMGVAEARRQGILLGPLVSKIQLERVTAAIEQARADGATVMTGGERPAHLSDGYFIEPTVLTNVPLDSRAWKEEIFGPVVCVRAFHSEDEAITLANDTRFGLAAAVMTSDDARAERVAAALRAGIVWINCSQPTFT
ncbi:aldehyde dehydrogenase family protein [Burkholderia sp. BCC1985]|uniref:aldehyde dehydrogenase family protein n=1 Tax=Burkholderia sp. BCC1985 TaxID=2817442 RepID=UPI002AB03241|nr:aldehyde dehydrogenase family protein [Burkholderia sp. BCC1985]